MTMCHLITVCVYKIVSLLESSVRSIFYAEICISQLLDLYHISVRAYTLLLGQISRYVSVSRVTYNTATRHLK
jgi:hypothetical protein